MEIVLLQQNSTIANGIIYLLAPLTLILIFLLLRLFIVKYFDAKKSKLQSKNYPIVLAMTLAFVGFISITSVWNQIIDLLIQFVNRTTSLELQPNPFFDVYNLVIYVIFCCLLSWVLYIHYRSYQKEQTRLRRGQENEKYDNRLKPTPPPDIPVESAIFSERIKEQEPLIWELV